MVGEQRGGWENHVEFGLTTVDMLLLAGRYVCWPRTVFAASFWGTALFAANGKQDRSVTHNMGREGLVWDEENASNENPA